MAKTRPKPLFDDDAKVLSQGSVECLGMTFASDDERRSWFTAKLREKLRDPAFRRTEGFPLGSDDDILRLSDPPYYTACPNPFLGEFITQHGTPYDPAVPYNREPFTVDVSEGKTDPIYSAHGYHTKVPHKAIMRAILHYTSPGQVVLDGFAGSGMVGVAAQMCGRPDPDFKLALDAEWRAAGWEPPEWRPRCAVLNDLGPAAAFIAANYNLPFDVDAFEQQARRLLDELRHELGWMYETLHNDGKTKGQINYTVWSEVFTCPNCSKEVVFYTEALEVKSKRIRDTFPCPHCAAQLTKDNLTRSMESFVDPATRKPWKRVRFIPVLINYIVGKKKHEKTPDNADLQVLKRIADMPLPPSVPTDPFPIETMYHGSRLAPKGFTRVHHLFLPRAEQALGSLWQKTTAILDPRLRNMLLFLVEQAIWGMSILARYAPTHFSQVNQYLTGVYYVGSQHAECSPWYILEGKATRLLKAFRQGFAISGHTAVCTGTAACLALPASSIDYIFTDPPFGENIFYADLNYLVESWHRVKTNTTTEAIIDAPKKKGLLEYQHLMQRCFEEYCRVLKPGRWMTLVFHNSRNSVWNAIQEAVLTAGFVVADVRTLDKQQGSYRQVTSTAVKQDLVISAYKPNAGLEERFKLEAATEEGVWDFLRIHLERLPVFVAKNERAESIVERQNFMLYDRMVAFHVLRGATVPLSAAEFYAGLDRLFETRDGMYFLAEQVAEYDRKRLTVKEVLQLELFVSDESSAIQWLRQQLLRKPQTFQELHPQFMRELAAWGKYERPLELRDILEQNFLSYDGDGEVPGQIHGYLSSNYKELRGLTKDAPGLRAPAKDRWYIADPNKAAEMEKLRERALLKEFEEYRQGKQKTLKVFRLEAVRAGFKKAWQERDYTTIIEVARRIPESVLQDDAKLLMWYDQALTRTGADA